MATTMDTDARARGYHARVALAGELSGAAGGFTVRVSEEHPFFEWKSSTTGGWRRGTADQARAWILAGEDAPEPPRAA